VWNKKLHAADSKLGNLLQISLSYSANFLLELHIIPSSPRLSIAFVYAVAHPPAHPKLSPYHFLPNPTISSLLPPNNSLPILSTLGKLRDIVKSHVGSESTEKSEPLLSAILSRFDSVLGTFGGDDDTAEDVNREKSTNWGLLLKDTVEFVEAHKGLVKDGTSQALRIDEDIRVLIDIAHSQVQKEGVNDKGYLVCFPLVWKLGDG